MNKLYVPGSVPDPVSLHQEEERREFWREARLESLKRHHKRIKKKMKRLAETTFEAAKSFGEAIEGFAKLFKGVGDTIKDFAESLTIQPPQKPRSSFIDIPTERYEISAKAKQTLNEFADAALGEKAQEFRLAQKWVDHAQNDNFIGPLPEAFESYRRDNANTTLLNEEFSKYAGCLQDNEMGYCLNNNDIVFSRTLIDQVTRNHPLRKGESSYTALAFREQVEPRTQKVFKLEWETPVPERGLAPIPVYS